MSVQSVSTVFEPRAISANSDGLTRFKFAFRLWLLRNLSQQHEPEASRWQAIDQHPATMQTGLNRSVWTDKIAETVDLKLAY